MSNENNLNNPNNNNSNNPNNNNSNNPNNNNSNNPNDPNKVVTRFEHHLFPVQGKCRISQDYKQIYYDKSGKKHGHKGIDIATFKQNNPVMASEKGVVKLAAEGNGENHHTGYGNVIEINHGNNEITLYAHLQKYIVTKGQIVERGQIIGNVGNTGNSTGEHLHYEQKISIDDNPVHDIPQLPVLLINTALTNLSISQEISKDITQTKDENEIKEHETLELHEDKSKHSN